VNCRHCGAETTLPLVDLGSAPFSNGYLSKEALRAPEKWYPLRVLTCTECWLAQTDDFADREELFSPDYAYFSSFSTTWLRHSECYVASVVNRFALDGRSKVIEVASNDGYLLQYVKALGIPCLGIEPTASTAAAARGRGIDVVQEFFGVDLADRLVAAGHSADLMVANNVLAHVPNINDFVAGFARLLKPDGVATFEFPHLMRLVDGNHFDTVYHEHFSYLSLTSATTVFARNGLTMFDVEELPTHGGSLRVYAQRADTGRREASTRLARLAKIEVEAGITSRSFYTSFQAKADRVKDDFLAFLIEARRDGKAVAAYGAAAKGNTLLNYAGIRPDLVRFVVDLNPAKQGKFMPGSRIPIVDEQHLQREKPDFIVILPWNLRAEVTEQLQYVKAWRGRFVTAVSKLDIDS
jgi:SAM-dependent methyltransferase